MILEAIRDGSIERLFLLLFVFAPLAYLWITGKPIDDRLIDVALVIMGYYFGSVVGTAIAKNGH